MEQINLIEIYSNDIDVEYKTCDIIFDTEDIIWSGYCNENKDGWQTSNKEKILKYYNSSPKFQSFLSQIKQDISWIDKIIIYK